ncbi:MAG: hypothetical protein CVU63_08165 [Deltaproteobacteria bacterium HGW-Deltaproteobacteria-20]|nr:MAG: hypothetical protein CVU63_08165 [Deltaproteobacteria bacterium HGW-Deltaproteobacteria-20]
MRDNEAIAVRVYPTIEAQVYLGYTWGYHSSSDATGLNSYDFQLVNGVDRLQAFASSTSGDKFYLLTFENAGESSSSPALTLKLWDGQQTAPPSLGATTAIAYQHLVVFGGKQPAPAACEGPRLEVYPVDQSAPVPSGAIPLADRTNATSVAAGGKVFIGFGEALSNCSSTGQALWDGAFYDPSTGAWEAPVTLPNMPTSAPGSFAPFRVLWSGAQVVVIEYLGAGPRVHLLAPGETAFRTRDIPLPVNTLFFGDDVPSDIDLSRVAVVPLDDELLVAAAAPSFNSPGYGDPQLWNPDTGAMTHVCDPPLYFVDRGTGGRTENGDIWLLSSEGSARLTLP